MAERPFRLEGKVAIVTGAGSSGEGVGNGKAASILFAREGAKVLLVDFDPPETVYWNLTSATIWHESHRYLTDPVSLTSSEVSKREDGTIRFIISREDPAHPNWIKTFAHDRGFLILRMVGVKTHPLPAVRRVLATELPGLM